jgi:hypothetical protein
MKNQSWGFIKGYVTMILLCSWINSVQHLWKDISILFEVWDFGELSAGIWPIPKRQIKGTTPVGDRTQKRSLYCLIRVFTIKSKRETSLWYYFRKKLTDK